MEDPTTEYLSETQGSRRKGLLSVIEKLRKAPSRPVWLDEKNRKPTRYNVYRADVREAMEFSRTPYYQYGFHGYLCCDYRYHDPKCDYD